MSRYLFSGVISPSILPLRACFASLSVVCAEYLRALPTADDYWLYLSYLGDSSKFLLVGFLQNP